MMTIDKALSLFTDMVNINPIVNLDYFKKNLNVADFKEFKELVEFIDLGKSLKNTEEFEKLFYKIDEYKREFYSMEQVANFRADKGCDDEDAIDELERIFSEEFDDE